MCLGLLEIYNNIVGERCKTPREGDPGMVGLMEHDRRKGSGAMRKPEDNLRLEKRATSAQSVKDFRAFKPFLDLSLFFLLYPESSFDLLLSRHFHSFSID